MVLYKVTRKMETAEIPDEEFLKKVNENRKKWNENNLPEEPLKDVESLEDLDYDDLNDFVDVVAEGCEWTQSGYSHEMVHINESDAHEDLEFGLH